MRNSKYVKPIIVTNICYFTYENCNGKVTTIDAGVTYTRLVTNTGFCLYICKNYNQSKYMRLLISRYFCFVDYKNFHTEVAASLLATKL